ncbi:MULTISPECIES: hypothetical protein [unclassified Crossiella]|uniref:hypothetical protein n=1 Tax=unclassified Crossiella TaxID=2620835 RepID=UPI00200023BE|nr:MULTISPECIES: hypothetical protein [unclassified Crossiella]MCK2239053.1 hypothetical protein [Crossiella sp. S99.2]MCK2251378.1 hypothetical protein [Crossiella sp. S99.1]
MSGYSFLPWLRAGLATHIDEDAVVLNARISIPVELEIKGEPLKPHDPKPFKPVSRTIALYGPGDVIGIDQRAISRVEPLPWITNFEPNYLAHIEFYEEDFPWRYSPDRHTGTAGRVRPWLALVVLAGASSPGEGDEFTEISVPGAPLPAITVLDPAKTLPPPLELGAWAHVHVNGDLSGAVLAPAAGGPLAALERVLRENPDLACSRLVCPRHLQPNTGYHAFLVPAFENGRLAGLGQFPAADALAPSWGGAGGALPYYHRWFFQTGTAGDFEYLVRILEPRFADPKIARRDIDVSRSPGYDLPPILAPTRGLLKLGGALQTDRPLDIFDRWAEAFPHPFQEKLAELINLADDYLTTAPVQANAGLTALPEPADPVITPPLYGRWPALTSRLLTGRTGESLVPDPANPNWLHTLNLDPRYRVAANFGTRIVQDRQEEFMAAAWQQVGEVLEGNARIRAAQLHREVGHSLQQKHFEPETREEQLLDATPRPGRKLTWTAPVHTRVTAEGDSADAAPAERVAVGFRVARSRIAGAPVSPAMRRATRPASRLMRTLFPPPVPGALDAAGPGAEELLPRMDDPAGVTAAVPKRKPVSLVTPKDVEGAPTLLAADPNDPPPDPVPGLPKNNQFRLRDLNDLETTPPGDRDSDEALNFKKAISSLYQGWTGSFAGARVPERPQLGVTGTAQSTLDNIRSDSTVLKRLQDSVKVPGRLTGETPRLTEALAYPRIDLPMYQALRDLDVEAFVPSLGLVPPNTITLLLTDQAYIEAFMVGLNHELARELLWREYPTDQRGTPFRQFWTPIGQPGQSREATYDIKPIHQWPATAKLGENDARDAGLGRPQEENLVLVIRGELLKKYPNAAIYAHKARWQRDPVTGEILKDQERKPVDLADPNRPSPVTEIRLPIYEAKVEPDLYLLGFPLSEAEAEGRTTDPGEDGSGWFFVIKERPGDPRFGLDETKAEDVEVWNDLSWPDVDNAVPPKGFLNLSATPTVPLSAQLSDVRDDDEKVPQRLEDVQLPAWHAGLSSAEFAYILFQAPVLMAVHAQEMLPDDDATQ